MNVKALHAGGWTIKQIAEHLGFHPATVSSWLKNGGPPPKRSVPEEDLVIDARWQARIAQLLAHNADLQGSSIMRVISAEGYPGSYQTLTRYLHSVRGPTRGAVAVTMSIETVPGEEFQFDWSDCNSFARRWGWDHELHCFGCVLCWSRIKFWFFAPSIDQHHTLEGLVRFFEAIGGVPALGRTDRMGQLGQSRSKGFVFHPLALTFARHHDLAFKACDAGDAKRKGKIERPFPGPQTRLALRSRPRSARRHRRAQPSCRSLARALLPRGAPTGRRVWLRPNASRRSATCSVPARGALRHRGARHPPGGAHPARRVGHRVLLGPACSGRQGDRGAPAHRLFAHRAALFGPDGGAAPPRPQGLRTPMAARAQARGRGHRARTTPPRHRRARRCRDRGDARSRVRRLRRGRPRSGRHGRHRPAPRYHLACDIAADANVAGAIDPDGAMS